MTGLCVEAMPMAGCALGHHFLASPPIEVVAGMRDECDGHGVGARDECAICLPSGSFLEPPPPPLPQGTERPSCAVVMSAGILNRSACGRSIDEHDLVFRMNWAPTVDHEHDVGTKSTLMVMNSHSSRRMNDGRQRLAACRAPFAALFYGDEWSPEDNETRQVELLNAMPRCQVPPEMGSKALKLHGHVGAWSGAFAHRFAGLMRQHRKPKRKVASAGWYAMHTAMALCGRLTLYGLGSAASAGDVKASPFHYYWDSPYLGYYWDSSSAAGRALSSAGRSSNFHELGLEHAHWRRLLESSASLKVCHMARPPTARRG